MSEIEVEIKYPLKDVAAVRASLRSLGAIGAGPPVVEADEYYGHPVRDFAATDEALRVRRTRTETILTYKGPRLDKHSKTRQEIEAPLATDLAECAAFAGETPLAINQILSALGFRSVLKVVKSRELWTLPDESLTVVCTLDHLESLGHFAELEVVTDQAHWQAARDVLRQWAERLGFGEPEHRSYLELLLSQLGRPTDRE
jgi:adenylate cyclase class 2